MAKFTYSLTFDDYLAFESFNIKRNKNVFFTYFICLLILANGVYDAVANKSYFMLIIAAAFIVAEAISTFYSVKIAPKKRINKMISLDASYLGQNEIILDDRAVEIKNIPAQNEAGTVCIYPYSVMTVIYETEEYYYFFISNEVKILPKGIIPDEYREYVKKTLSKNQNYMFVK